MNYGIYILFCLLFLLTAAGPLFAQGGYSEFERDLQLSDTQRLRVEETKRKYMNDLQGLNQDYVNKRLELREIDRSPSPDQERRQRLRSELRAIESSRHGLYNQYRSDVSRALNDEQRLRYNSFVGTERRRTVTRPSSPSPEAYANPPMTRISPPVIYSRPSTSMPGQAMGPVPYSRYGSAAPPSNRSMGPFSPRTSAPPPPRGHGR